MIDDIVTGHEAGLCTAAFGLSILLFAIIVMMQIEDILSGKYSRRKKPKELRPFHERDYDPHKDDNNLGRH